MLSAKLSPRRFAFLNWEHYTHDGNYHAAILVEGEEAELYKTFYSDMEYRVAICGEENLPNVEFMVLDASRNILFQIKTRMEISQGPGTSNYRQASSLNWLLRFPR